MDFRKIAFQMVRNQGGRDCDYLARLIRQSFPGADAAAKPATLEEYICELKNDLPADREEQQNQVRQQKQEIFRYQKIVQGRRNRKVPCHTT